MIIPLPISKGDTIGIVAPASPFEPSRLRQGIDLIRQMGFAVDMRDDLMAPDKYLANTDAARAEQINQYFADKNIKAIVCARGGYGAGRILPLIDYEMVRKNSKIFMGFSDNTFLLNAFYKQCGLVTFHGPMVTTLAESDEISRKSFMHALLGTGDFLCLEGFEVVHSGKVSGPVIGGNMAVLSHLMGTSYQPDSTGCLLFLEDRGEALYRIDRMMMHLKQADFLKNIKGMLLGSFENCGLYADVVELASDICSQLEIPLVAGLAAGHGTGNLTIPIGRQAILDTQKPSITFKSET